MTPIKDFLVYGNMIFTRDHADIVELTAVCPDTQKTDWVVATLCKMHGKQFHDLTFMPGVRITDEQLSL